MNQACRQLGVDDDFLTFRICHGCCTICPRDVESVRTCEMQERVTGEPEEPELGGRA